MRIARRTLAIGAAASLFTGMASAQLAGVPYANGPILATVIAPTVGTRLDAVFLTPPYRVDDSARWDLPTVPPGYGWVRYWDKAVLVDSAGTVLNAQGVRWDAEAAVIRPRVTTFTTRTGPAIIDPSGPNRRPRVAYTDPSQYDRDSFDPRCFEEPNDAGRIGGALAGAALGGVAGGLLAGSGDGLGGALIGGGLGALAGGVAGDQLGRNRSPVGPCPDTPPANPVITRGYGYPDVYGDDRPLDDEGAPGTVTTTTITWDEPVTTTVVDYGE